ncbi:MAG: cellulase family glycosylhydrolase, partial [Thermoguttaceae bacterium]
MEITRCLARHRTGAVAAIMCVLGTTMFCRPSGSANAQTPDVFSQNKRLGRGVNVIGYDPLWQDRQKARFQEKYFRLIQEAGFNHVRVNLHPFRDAKLGADYKPSAAWFETLDWAVKHALANRLMVILDFHEFQAMGDDPAGNKERFLAVWRQIAEHCKDAPDDVVFEILNEPNKKVTPERWNALLRDALGIIRQS